jgi:hypothetical protein
MATYSIDLGIDANATAGAAGTESDPYPMQIALTRGVLTQDPSNGQFTGFEPEKLASFDDLRSGDTIIFSVFNITSIGSKGDRSFAAPEQFPIKFTNLRGTPHRPWIDHLVSRISPGRKQLSLAFSRGPEKHWPCFFQWNDSQGIIANTLAKVTEPTSFLLTITIPVFLAGLPEKSYFRTDPEMVISPDEDPCPDQPPAMAATSRW